MNNIQPKKAVIWLSKIGLYFYIEGLPSIFNMPFFGESVKYFDVVDEVKLTKQLEDFLTNNKIPPINAHFIIGQDALVEKEFLPGNEEAMKQYLEMIPYELVYSKRTLKPKSILVTAFNGDFYRIVSSVVEKNRGKIISLLPYSLISQNSLTAQTASLILKKAESLKKESMVDTLEKTEPDIPVITPTKSSEEKSTLPVLIPIFIVLVVVLIVVIFISSRQSIPSVNFSPTPSPIILPSPTNFPLTAGPEATTSPTKIATNSAL